MSKLSLLAAAAALALSLGGAASAADPPGDHVGGAPHVGGQPHVGGPGGMPPRGFHTAPPTFQGSQPHGVGPGAPRYQVGRSGHDLGLFNGHRFSQFTADERSSWMQGGWRHETHDGHLGWWWVVGDLWFFYPAPIYPYPGYVGPEYYYDYYQYYPSPSYYWYYCEDPAGYYPSVQQCNGPWEPVPPAG